MTLLYYIGFIPILGPHVCYYQCFSMVRKIDIDEKEKILKIDYTKFFFWKKSKKFRLDDPTFRCSILNTKYNIITRLFCPHSNIVIGFDGSTDKSPWTLLLKDRCGWKREQVLVIYQKLEKYSHSEESI